MTFSVRWTLKGEKAEMKLPAAREALHKARELIAQGAEDVSITNPDGETFDIHCFGLITKGMDDPPTASFAKATDAAVWKGPAHGQGAKKREPDLRSSDTEGAAMKSGITWRRTFPECEPGTDASPCSRAASSARCGS
jgi:hypothetical protein